MRTSIWPGLLKTLQYNVNRQQSRVRIVETGLTFVQSDAGLAQEKMISGLAFGARSPKGWFDDGAQVDFYDVKADVESLLALTRQEFSFAAAEHSALHPGQTAAVLLAGKQVGLIGALHPAIAKKLGVKGSVILFELNVGLIERGNLPLFSSLSKFPETARDIAVIVDDALPVDKLLSAAKETAGEFVTDINLFDVYRGQGIAQGKKSLAIGLTWQHPESTLNVGEVNNAM